MSFWNFIGKFALVSLIWDLFSNKSRSAERPPYRHNTAYIHDPLYQNRIDELNQQIKESKMKIAESRKTYGPDIYRDLDDYDIDDIEDRIDELEEQLDACDEMSEEYDLIQDRIDELEDQLEDYEYRRDEYYDYQDDYEDEW